MDVSLAYVDVDSFPLRHVIIETYEDYYFHALRHRPHISLSVYLITAILPTAMESVSYFFVFVGLKN